MGKYLSREEIDKLLETDNSKCATEDEILKLQSAILKKCKELNVKNLSLKQIRMLAHELGLDHLDIFENNKIEKVGNSI